MITYKKSSDMPNASFIKDVLKLDSQLYPKELQGTFTSVSNRFEKNKQSYILAYDGSTLIGYICFLNISPELRKKLLAKPIYKDDLITCKDVREFNLKNPNTLYIISIVVSKQYQKKGIGNSLIDQLKMFTNSLILTGYTFDYILAETVSDDGYKLLTNHGFETIKEVKNGVHFVSFKFDDYSQTNVYAFIPCRIIDNKFINKYNEASSYSEMVSKICKNELNENVYVTIGRHNPPNVKAIVYNDQHEIKIAELEVEISITRYKDVCCLTMIFQHLGFEPTYLLDSLSTISIEIEGFNSIDNYLESIGLSRSGDIKAFTSLMQKPSHTHLLFMLAGEEYIKGLVEGSNIVSHHFNKFASDNISQYDFSDIYASETGVVYVLKPKYMDSHMLYDVYMTFIIERAILQLASVQICNKTLLDLMDKQLFDSEHASNFVREFSKYSYLWTLDIYKYALPNHLYSIISNRFGINDNKKIYDANLNLYEKLSSLESNLEREKISQKSKNYFTIFTLLSTFGTLNTIIGLIFAIIDSKSLQAIVALSVGVGALIIFQLIMLLSYIDIRKNRKKRKQSTKNRF